MLQSSAVLQRVRAARCGVPAEPAAEGLEEPIACFLRHGFLGEPAQKADGLPELFQVGPAQRAVGKVRLEPRAIEGRQAILEIVGDELDELAARQLGQVLVDHADSFAARYCSSALRTRDRARCSNTR